MQDDMKPPLIVGLTICFLVLIVGVLTLIVVGRYGGKSSEPPPMAAPSSAPEPKVDSKKLSKKERAFVVAVEAAYGKNLSAAREKNAVRLGHTYCAVARAGFSNADIVRLYGKHKERPEAPGVNLLSLSKKTLCPH